MGTSKRGTGSETNIWDNILNTDTNIDPPKKKNPSSNVSGNGGVNTSPSSSKSTSSIKNNNVWDNIIDTEVPPSSKQPDAVHPPNNTDSSLVDNESVSSLPDLSNPLAALNLPTVRQENGSILNIDPKTIPVTPYTDQTTYVKQLQERINTGKKTKQDENFIINNVKTNKNFDAIDEQQLSGLLSKYDPQTSNLLSLPVPDFLSNILPETKGKTFSEVFDTPDGKLAVVKQLKENILKQESLNRANYVAGSSVAGAAIPADYVKPTQEQSDEYNQLDQLQKKLSYEANKKDTYPIYLEGIVRTDESGNLWNKFLNRTIAMTSPIAGATLPPESIDVRQTLPPEFSIGLNGLKYTEPAQFERVTKYLKSGDPISSTLIANITAQGLEAKEAMAKDAFISQDISQDQYNLQMKEINDGRYKNIVDNKEVLRGFLSNGIANLADDVNVAKQSQTDALGLLDNKIFGHRWNYTDKEIEDYGKSYAQANGIDPNDARVKDAIKYLQDNEGAMIMQNSIAKAGWARDFAKGLAAPIRGISNTLEDIGKTNAEIYAEGQSQGNANVSEDKVSRVKNSWEGVVSDVMEGTGQFVTQAGLMYATSGLVGEAGTALADVNMGARTAGELVGNTAKIGEMLLKSKDGLSIFTTSYAQAYDSDLKTAMTYTSDDSKARITANIMAGLEGATELWLSPLEIAEGISKKFLNKKEVSKGIVDILSDAAIVDKNAAVKNFLKAAVKGGLETMRVAAGEIGEEEVTQLADFASNAVLNPDSKSFQDRSMMGEVASTAYQTGLSMVIPALVSGMGAYNVNKFAKGSLLIAAQNRQQLIDMMNERMADGNMTQDEFNEKSSIINTAAIANETLPIKEDGKKLNSEEKADYIFSRVSEAILNKKSSETEDVAAKAIIEKKIKKEQDFRINILNEKPASYKIDGKEVKKDEFLNKMNGPDADNLELSVEGDDEVSALLEKKGGKTEDVPAGNGKPQRKKNKIESAVIEIGGKNYEGKNHAEAILKAKADGQDISQVDRAAEGKFKLSDGSVIDRAEAKDKFGADRAEQLIPQDEAADQANKDYKTKQPSSTVSSERMSYDELNKEFRGTNVGLIELDDRLGKGTTYRVIGVNERDREIIVSYIKPDGTHSNFGLKIHGEGKFEQYAEKYKNAEWTNAADIAEAERVKKTATVSSEVNKQLEGLVNQIPVTELRRPNGSIGTQGFVPENLVDVARHIAKEMGFAIPAHDKSLGTSEIKQVIDYLKSNKEAQDKIKEYVTKDPVVVQKLPDDSYSIYDGNHRANLLNLIGVDTIPTINLDGKKTQERVDEHNKSVEEILNKNKPIQNEVKANEVQSDDDLAKEVLATVVGMPEKADTGKAIEYAIDKAVENPSLFQKDYPELFDKIKDRIPTDKIEENLDYYIEHMGDSPNVKILDDMLSERLKATPEEIDHIEKQVEAEKENVPNLNDLLKVAKEKNAALSAVANVDSETLSGILDKMPEVEQDELLEAFTPHIKDGKLDIESLSSDLEGYGNVAQYLADKVGNKIDINTLKEISDEIRNPIAKGTEVSDTKAAESEKDTGLSINGESTESNAPAPAPVKPKRNIPASSNKLSDAHTEAQTNEEHADTKSEQIQSTEVSGQQNVIEPKVIPVKNKPAKKVEEKPVSTVEGDVANDVKVVPLSSLHTDEKRFQNRNELNQQVVNDIAENWNDANQDPIHVWTDPKDNKTYVLSGHHRIAGAEKAGRETVKIIDRTNDFNEEQAIKFAREEANANRTMETPIERAAALRNKIASGDSKDEINKFLEREGKNKNYVQNLAALNPKGKTLQTLEQFVNAGDKQTQKESEQRADWIGEARRTISGITDAHENEMFDFLFDKSLSKRVTTKSDFLQKVRSISNPLLPEQPLNIARFKNKTQGEAAYEEDVNNKKEEIGNVQEKINDLSERFNNPQHPNYVATDSKDYPEARKIADDKISKLESERKILQKQLEDIYRDKGKYTGAAPTGVLFSPKEAANDFESSDKTPVTVEALQKKYPDAIVVKSQSDLPQEIQDAAKERELNAEGVHHNGKVYLVADNLATMGRAEGVYKHESIGHAGVIAHLKDKLDGFARTLVNNATTGQTVRLEQLSQKLFKMPIAKLSIAEKSTLGQEYIAQAAENPTKSPVTWDKIVSWVRGKLRDFGIKLAISDKDIKVLLDRVAKKSGEPIETGTSFSEKNKLSLQKVSQYANDIITGKKIFERFSPQEQRGFAEGGQIHAEASIILAADEGAGGQNNATPEAQENRIETYAKEKGVWTDNTTEELTKKHGEPIGSGEEAIVWGEPKEGKVIKTQDTFQYDNLQQKLDGITLHNAYFPEAPLKVLGFGKNGKGEFQVIVEQPFIKGEKLTTEEIKTHLENIGFKQDENGHFANNDTIVEDVHTGNAIKTPEGNVVVIDPIMRLNTPEQGYGGTREIGKNSEPLFSSKEMQDNLAKARAAAQGEEENTSSVEIPDDLKKYGDEFIDYTKRKNPNATATDVISEMESELGTGFTAEEAPGLYDYIRSQFGNNADTGTNAESESAGSNESKSNTGKKAISLMINSIGENNEDAVLDGVNHRKNVGSDVAVGDVANSDKLILGLSAEDAINVLDTMKDIYKEKYLSKALTALKGLNKNTITLDKRLAFGIAIENEIKYFKEGIRPNEFNIKRNELNRIYAEVQKINVLNSRESSKALNTTKTLYNYFDNTAAQEGLLTKEQYARKQSILDTLTDFGKMDEAAENYEATGNEETESKPAKDERKTKPKQKSVESKLKDILTELKDKLDKLDC